MWQFAEAVRGLADGCRELGLPVTGGNVSLYNQTGDVADQPDAGHRRAGRARGRPPAHPVRLAGRRRDGPAARRDAAGVRRLGLGGGRARPPRRHARRSSTSPPSARWASCSPRLGRDGLVTLRARPRRRRPGADARGVGPALRRRRPAAPGRRPVHRAVQRVRRPRRRHDADSDAVAAAERAGVPVTELGTTGGDSLVVDGVLELGLAEQGGKRVAVSRCSSRAPTPYRREDSTAAGPARRRRGRGRW